MIRNHHKILAAVLVAQIALTVVVFWPRPSTAGQREPVFPDLTAQDVTAVTIEDEQGNRTALERVAGNWVLPDADQYPAEGDTVDAFLDKFLSLTTGRLVTERETSHKRLRVAADEFARRVDLETGDGEMHTVYIGSSPQYGSVHFRLGGQSDTYLTSQVTTWDINASESSWIDTSYQSVTQDEVTRMTLENENGTFIFERSDDGAWTMVEPAIAEDEGLLNETQVESVLRRAATISMRRPLGKEEDARYGMDSPSAQVALETSGGTVTLVVGAKDEDDASYVVKSSQSDYYVDVAATTVAALVENDRAAFILQPTPQPESDSS